MKIAGYGDSIVTRRLLRVGVWPSSATEASTPRRSRRMGILLLQPIFPNRHALVAPVQALELALAQSRPMQQIPRQQPQN